MISVLVPYRPTDLHRIAAWNWIYRRWMRHYSLVDLIVGGDTRPDDPFGRGAAINHLATQAHGDTFVIADADTAPDPHQLNAAIAAVQGGAAWALPSEYRKLTAEATIAALASSPTIDLAHAECEWVGTNICWSGMIVVRREAFEAVGGFDERFHRWGEDDTSFAAAISTLVEPVTRIEGACYHLWHPASIEETYGAAGFAEMRALAQRYLDAWNNPDEMRKVRFDV